ncbi:hypothetical protein NKH98_28215 [Mesorhizobium sp. M0833]|uniref:hypothetical protein n=1 Tax=Mesorhizobium sp. M0833 TaxID=2957009 RepID=UPI00333582AA
MLTAAACLLVVTLGAFLRLVGTNWDEGANLHPDERHMMFVVSDTMTGLAALKPGDMSLAELWFATGESPFDPRQKERLYVYGELPHLAVSGTAWLAGMSGWPEVLRLARTMGAVLDAYTILAVFLLGTLALRSAPAGLGAATLYALSPLAIQHANFFTVDIWLTAATAWCLVAATMLVRARSQRAALGWAAASGALAGIALACKLPGLALFGVVVVAIVVNYRGRGAHRRLASLAAALALALVFTCVAFRLACPFTFQGPGIFGLALAPNFIKGYAEMSHVVLDPGFPPNWQWIAGYSPARALLDLGIWGLGPVTTVALVASLALLAWRGPPSWPGLLPLAALAAAITIYWISGPIPALRYVMPALPALCVIAAAPFPWLAASLTGRALLALMVVAAGLWGLGMVTLHSSTNSRVAASRWLWLNTQPGTVLVNETPWDDGLPVPVRLSGKPELAWAGQGEHFELLTFGLEAPDNEEKAAKIAKLLDQADLVILSSERMRKPITALASRFPMTSAYYEMLGSGELCFERVYRDQRGYPVLGFAFSDRSAQEPWSVYDHPTVEIYRKLGCYERQRTQSRLIQALANGS